MRYLFFITIFFLLFSSCKSDNDLRCVIMQDGKAITINSSDKYYNDEDEFLHNVSFSFPRFYKYTNVDNLDYTTESNYTLTGFSQIFIGGWEFAKFGQWIRKYGLQPNKGYYVATMIYAKYISLPPTESRIIPIVGTQFMGYCPQKEATTFQVDTDYNAQVSILITGVRFIGYDSDGSNINIEMSSFADNNNILTWKFLIRDNNDWD